MLTFRLVLKLLTSLLDGFGKKNICLFSIFFSEFEIYFHLCEQNESATSLARSSTLFGCYAHVKEHQLNQVTY